MSTPIRRGTARRLGLDVPCPPPQVVVLSYPEAAENFARNLAAAIKRMEKMQLPRFASLRIEDS
jgi:hypothetical protein